MLFKSPAKINLFFRVLRKRSDGYHEIASILQAIDLFDTLEFTQCDFDSLTCSDPDLPCDESNLVIKALRIFKSQFPLPFGVKIHLEKKIPCQAGLGGGSSNAATTLWALNELVGSPASLPQLMAMGASLGSDVSFFFSSGTACCTGRGEIIDSHQLLEPLEGWLAKPPFGLSTPLVYKETRVEELPTREGLFFNDLEPAAFRLEPRLKEFRGNLEKMGFNSVTMTGSGTAFFCFGKGKEGKDLIPFLSVQRDAGCWYIESLRRSIHS